MLKRTITLMTLACITTASFAQGSRLFLDVLNLYLLSPDVANINDRVGLGDALDFNVGTHNLVARVGGGANVTLAPKADDLKESLLTSPFGHVELGAGLYRTNGNKCSLHSRGAYTALGKGQLQYDFKAKAMDYSVGTELGYFYIRDMFKNTELVLRGDYWMKAKVVSVQFGFKLFLNLKAERD